MASRYEDKEPRPIGAISTQEASIIFMDSRKTVPNDFHEPKQPRHPGLSQACSQELEIEKPSHEANDHERTSTTQQTQRKSRRQGNVRRPSDHVCQMKTGPLQIEAKEESQGYVHSHHHLGDTQGAQVQNKNLLQKAGFLSPIE